MTSFIGKANQEEDIAESYELQQQLLNQANEIVAALMEQSRRLQHKTSKLFRQLLYTAFTMCDFKFYLEV